MTTTANDAVHEIRRSSGSTLGRHRHAAATKSTVAATRREAAAEANLHSVRLPPVSHLLPLFGYGAFFVARLQLHKLLHILLHILLLWLTERRAVSSSVFCHFKLIFFSLLLLLLLFLWWWWWWSLLLLGVFLPLSWRFLPSRFREARCRGHDDELLGLKSGVRVDGHLPDRIVRISDILPQTE